MEAYIPGQFYKRELPYIIKILEQVNIPSLDAILVDGYIYTDDNGELLINKLSILAKMESTPLELTHEEFITFMKDFKKFIEENS